MKRYRVWEANARSSSSRKTGWTEFRDDKTHLFRELEGICCRGMFRMTWSKMLP